MESSSSVWLAVRLDPPDAEGTCTLTFITGGRHRGGISEGRMTWTGGLSILTADMIGQKLHHWTMRWVQDQDQPILWSDMLRMDPPLV